jgi:hypothetical protein
LFTAKALPMPLTPLDRQKRLRARRAKLGLFPVTVYAPVHNRRILHAFAKHLVSREVEGIVIRNQRTGRVATIPIDDY